YGTTYGAAISFHFDPKEPLYSAKISTPPLPPAVRDPQQRQSSLDDLNRKNQVVALNNSGRSLNLGTDPADLKEILASVPSSAARDYEIDGRTLAIDIDGPADMQAQCRIFAQVIANSTSGIDTIAITDLSSRDGDVVLCPVRPANQAVVASVTKAPAVNAAPATSGDSPVLDEQTLLFRPRVTDPHRA